MKITSVFENGEAIPEEYACDGRNINFPIHIMDIPMETKSIALIFDDPDSIEVTGKVFTHWTVWNIPAETSKIEEISLPEGAREAMNDLK